MNDEPADIPDDAEPAAEPSLTDPVERKQPRSTSIKGTSGRGYRYETQVGVWFAAAMLANISPLPRHGDPIRIRFMTDDEGWLFDDQLVTFADGHRLAISVKSNQQFEKRTAGYVANPGLAEEAWGDALGQGAASFDPERDRLALIAPPPPAEVSSQLDELQILARDPDPGALDRRMEGTASLRTLYQSFNAPEVLGTSHPAAWLLARFEVIGLDFESPTAAGLAQALAWCRDALDPESAARADELYEALYLRIDEVRTSGGEITRGLLIGWFRSRFPLRSLAASEAKAHLDARTERNIALIPAALAQTTHLQREGVRSNLLEGLRQESYLAITGRSGVGKTVIAARTLHDHDDCDLVWISAADLEQEGAAVEADIERALDDASGSLAVVLLDGLDRSYDPQVFRRAARVIQIALANPHWGVALTSSTDSLQRVTEQLAANNVQAFPARHEIPPLSLSDLSEVADAFPTLRRLLANKTFQPILANPKQLDLVIRTATPDTTPTESGLARLYWENLVLQGEHRHARAHFLERLAERQAERLEASTPRSELGDVAPLGSLEDDDICIVRNSRVAFSHDLYGDWTRVWLLDAIHETLPDYLSERLHSPLWNRAIRLRASGYLSAGDIDGWRAFRRELPPDDELIDDLFVEASLFAAEPADAIRALWDDLVADKARLLKRLLGRLRLVATTPNEAMVSFFQMVDPTLESYARVANRDPIWPLWIPPLQVLAERLDQVVRLAPTSAAQVATIWLERTPENWPFRTEAARLALAVAVQMYELKRDNDVLIEGDPDEVAYQAFLAAAAELPDQVSDLALRLAGRRDPQLHRRGYGGETEAWPEGPQGEVDDGFRDVCLKTAALQRLMRVRPAVVSEVLLGLLIEEPRERRQSPYSSSLLFGSEFGLHPIHYWISPMWHRGPFVSFFQMAPAEAIRFAAALVNFATARYTESARADGSDPGSTEVDLPAGALAHWDGDARVYGWFRGTAPQSVVVTSVLMALEYSLYQRLDADEDVDELIRLIFDEAESVAFAGLLVAIGLHTQRLFGDVLKPLLAVPELYRWDQERVVAIESSAGLIAGFLPQDPAPLVEQARRFHALEHRRHTLERLALTAYLNAYLDLDEFFAEARAKWLARASALDPNDPEREWLERLAARFNRGNYEVVTTAQGVEQWRFIGSGELDEEARRQLEEANEAQMLLGLPMQIRKVLDGEMAMGEQQFVDLLRIAHEQEKQTTPRLDLFDPVAEAEHRANVVCGAAAVGVEKFRDWLRAHPDEESWCITTLLTHVKEPPENEDGHYFPGTPWEWHVFCAHALPTLWAEEPESDDLRNVAALLAMFPNQAAVEAFSIATARVRQALGEEYVRLQHFILDWALLLGEMRDLAHRRQWSQPEAEESEADMHARFAEAAEVLRRRQADLVTAFVSARLDAVIPQWSLTALAQTETEVDARRRRGQARTVIDVEYLAHAFVALPTLDEAYDDEERSRLVAFWREGVSYLTTRLGGNSEDDREVEGTPYQSDYWLLRRIGPAVAEMRPDEEAQALWQPMLDIASAAHYWVEEFLRTFVERGLTGERPQHFLTAWRAMVSYARSAASWDPHRRRVFRWVDNWILLLGLDPFTARNWTSNNKDLAEAMADEYVAMLPLLIEDERTATALVHFLREDGSAPLRADALALLAEAAERTNLWRDRDDRIATPLAELLEQLFSRGDATIRTSAFTKLLRYLAARQVPLAVELLNRLGRS
jgi:hypothetical protein